MKVNFWCMRHGEKDAAGNVTARGLRQVEASARKHLSTLVFDLVLHSGMPRTHDSARRVQTVLNLDCPVVPFPMFGYEHGGTVGFEEARARINQPHDQTTVQNWLDNWDWRAGVLRGNMRANLLAGFLYVNHNPVLRDAVAGSDEVNVLVVGHSPGLEMAADEPAVTTSMNPADIICYEVGMDEAGFMTIRTDEAYRCPPVE